MQGRATARIVAALGLGSPAGSWQELALCAQTDPEAFFPEKGGSTRKGREICQRCPVARECLTHALANHERFGIWGGLTERERRVLQAGGRPEDLPTAPGRQWAAALIDAAPTPHEERLAG